MPSDSVEHAEIVPQLASFPPSRVGYLVFKLGIDIAFCVAAAPFLFASALALLCLNPFLNPGPLLFGQNRMGRNAQCFRMWKFRTMLLAPEKVRAHDAPVEHDRITRLGRFLRKSRIDEMPNLINILRGEMSLVGPRPDAWEHAKVHSNTVPRYRRRFSARPGITGLAQIRNGYADCDSSIRRKARLDSIYIDRSGLRMELYIILKTVRVVLTGFGAK